MDPVEEKIYEIAGQEISTKAVRPGLWTKAFADANGDEQKTKVTYIELRVAELRDELAAEIGRQIEADSDRRSKEGPLIRERFSWLKNLPYQSADNISRSLFVGNQSQLRYPISAMRVAEVTDCLLFEIIDFIKRGFINGVFDGDDWYCDLEAENQQNVESQLQ